MLKDECLKLLLLCGRDNGANVEFEAFAEEEVDEEEEDGNPLDFPVF